MNENRRRRLLKLAIARGDKAAQAILEGDRGRYHDDPATPMFVAPLRRAA